MKKSVGIVNPIIVITLIFPINFATTTLAWDIYQLWTYSCSFPSNPVYETNLNHTLSSIISNKNITNGFYNFSTGRDPNKASAIALCRGDVNLTSCHTCLNDVANSLQTKCNMNKEAIGFEDQCMLRYSNRSFFGRMETSPAFRMRSVANLSDTEVVPFNEKRDQVFDNLVKKATSGMLSSYFETGNRDVTDDLKVYAMVQCTPDISGSLCSQCLDLAINNIPNFCGENAQGCRVQMPSCNLRFEKDLFYVNSSSTTTSSEVAPAPAPTPTPTSSSFTASPPSAHVPRTSIGHGSPSTSTSYAMTGWSNFNLQKTVLMVLIVTTVLGLPSAL